MEIRNITHELMCGIEVTKFDLYLEYKGVMYYNSQELVKGHLNNSEDIIRELNNRS